MSTSVQSVGQTPSVRAILASVHLSREAGDSSLVTLTNANGMEVRFIARGGIILSMLVPDANGAMGDVVLGFDDLALYVNDRFYFGALVGRNANRVANGEFTLDGKHYSLTRNDGPNHLHGGTRGFSAYEWAVKLFERDEESGAVLSIVSPDGDQGYPGAVTASVSYTLNDSNEFVVRYRATVDAPTPIDLTQHTYFNLSGSVGRDVLDHELMVCGSFITPVDATLIPTGELRSVTNTPFDFRTACRIGDRIGDPDEQLRLAGGYDHNYVLDTAPSANESNVSAPNRAPSGAAFTNVKLAHVALTHAARLHDRHSGRTLDVLTTEPAIQVYTGNELDQVPAGKGGAYARYAGIALETQHFPNTPNQASFPTSIIRPGQEYVSETVYRFSVELPPGDRLVVVT
ncbi:MAG: aldose epimerase family protein [Gemmatimonadaceae bacterium]